jgi:predicted enzyme related to lactoylglutathione lyase
MPGRLVHFELQARDAVRARAFWSGVFGWEFADPGLDVQYWMTRTGEEQGGAVYPVEGEPNGLLAYFDSDDIDATIERVRSGGGEAGDKQPIPGVGWFAHCLDTEGNRFGVFERDGSVGA